MFTVLHRDSDLCESVEAFEFVTYWPKGHKLDGDGEVYPNRDAVVIGHTDNIEINHTYRGGHICLMNDQGKTVASYDL